MHPLNWLIVVGWIAYIVYDGVRRAKGTKEIEGYFLANRTLPWWAVGLSVMATQLSAVTMIGTTGQGATDGMRFIQFYFGLPLAMVILGVTLVPFLHGARVFTAYEYLERRFDAKTRSLTAFLFLLSRGMSCGTIIAAPARRVLRDLRLEHRGWSVALIGRADGPLHDDRRRAGRDLGGREADGPDRRRALRGRGRRCSSSLPVSPDGRADASPAPPDGCASSTSRSVSPTRTRSGRASSAARS